MTNTAPDAVDRVHLCAAHGAAHERVLLRSCGLRKAFGGQVVLDGIDLELHRGEVVLLRGENGSGKTTLLNILTGNLEPDSGTIEYLADDTPRSYRFPRHWWQDLNPFDHFTPEFVAREGIGRTWQDVRLFGAQSLRDNIAVAEPGHSGENPLVALLAPGRTSLRESELNAQADTMLARLGLAGRESSSADMVSLGQSKRVAIARAVAAGAKILFLDEPLAGLDRQGILNVITMLESLVLDEKLTVVIVEHVFNQPHLHGLVTTDWLLESGKLQRNGTHSSQSAINNQQPSGARHTANGSHRGEAGVPRQSAIRNAEFTRPSWFSLLAGDDAEILDEPLPRGAVLTRIRRPGRWTPDAKPVLEIKGLVVKRGQRTVIGLDEHGESSSFDLPLSQGEVAVLQAPNGWGKSTLLSALSGQIQSDEGTVFLSGNFLQDRPVWDRANSGLLAVPAERTGFPSLTGNEILSLTPYGSGRTPERGVMTRPTSSMSGGEIRKLMLRTLQSASSRTKAIILDEPFAALDERAAAEVAHFITSISCPILILVPSAAH